MIAVAYFTGYYTGSQIIGGAAGGWTATGNSKGLIGGGITGAAFYGVGTLGQINKWNLYEMSLAHAFTGGVTNSLMGGDFRGGFLSAGFARYAGVKFQTATGYVPVDALVRGIIGGFAAKIGGGDFGNAAVTASFAYLFNDAVHPGAVVGAGEAAGEAGTLLGGFLRVLTSPVVWLSTLLSGDTPQGDLYMHYGYAADEGSFSKGLSPGGYATEYGPPMTGAQAQQLLALPHATPPDAYYVVRIVPSGSVPVIGPLTVSGTDVPPRTGGGIEYRFPQGTPPGSVMGPFPLPR